MSYYGYKNHVSTDRRYKLVRCYAVTDASVHDSQVIEKILDPDNTAAKVWADKAYRSEEIEEMLEELGYKSMIAEWVTELKLTKREKQGNGTKAKVRARVEHVFGAQANDMGGTMLRSIGAMRARTHIGLRNLAYNMRRLTHWKLPARPKPSCASPCRQATRKARSAATNLANGGPHSGGSQAQEARRPATQRQVTLFNQTSRHLTTSLELSLQSKSQGGNKSRCPCEDTHPHHPHLRCHRVADAGRRQRCADG